MKKAILLLFLSPLFLHSFSQKDTVLVLSKTNGINVVTINKEDKIRIKFKNSKSKYTGYLTSYNKEYLVGWDKDTIRIKDIRKINIFLSNRERRTKKIIGGIIASLGLANPLMLAVTLPIGVYAFTLKSKSYKIPHWQVVVMELDQQKIDLLKNKNGGKIVIIDDADSIYRHRVFTNLSKLADNIITLSFENIHLKNKLIGHELEAGYIFPGKDNNFNKDIRDATISPYKYYQGFTGSYTFKKYYYSTQNFKVKLNYFGFNLMYKYTWFEDKWFERNNRQTRDGSVLMSQFKNAAGLSIRFGQIIKEDNLVFEPYIGIGYKIQFNKANYHCFRYANGKDQYTDPPSDLKPSQDDGFYMFPYFSLGLKFGFNLK